MMGENTNGLMMMILGVVLAVLYLAIPTFLVYVYWIAVIILILYGLYLFRKR
jgi:hypothetical protein